MGNVIQGEKIHYHDYRPSTGTYKLGAVFQCTCGQCWLLTNQRYQNYDEDYWYETKWVACENTKGERWFSVDILDKDQPTVVEMPPRSLRWWTKWICPDHGKVDKDHVHTHTEQRLEVRLYKRHGDWLKGDA